MSEPLAVLIIEDDRNDVDLCVDALRDGGFDVKWLSTETEDGMRAALRRDHWDIVLSDHAMPQFDALAAIATLREYERETPFIIVSGAIGEEAAVDAMRHGVADYVPKHHIARLETTVRRELRAAQERRSLRLARERIALLAAGIAQSSDGVVIYERVKGDTTLPIIVYANAAVERDSGFSQHELLGRTCMVFVDDGGDQEMQSLLNKAFEQCQPVHAEVLNRRRNGEAYWVEISVKPLVIPESGAVHWVSTRRDVTERRRVTEMLRKSELALTKAETKAEFVATMSHEVRTPLTAVVGMSELLLETTLTLEQAEYAQLLHEASQSLMRIINDILDFSKMEAGRLELEVLELKPHALVESVVAMLLPAARAKGIGLQTSFDSKIPVALLGDGDRLRQVLVNLVGNAIKFTERGSVLIRVKAVETTCEQASVQFSIRDTGIGIDDGVRARLFEAFRQGDASMSRRFGGSGLGLAISKRIVELMGGHIEVESSVGKGSTFSFSVALALPKGKKRVVAAEHAAPANRTLERNARVLVAEDNIVNQRLIEAQLQKLGCRATIVSTGRGAVDEVASARYDVILMDCQMPDLDGLAATRAIRGLETRTGEHVPIIALTANARPGDREACLASGMDDHLAKPVTLAALRSMLLRWLRRGVRSGEPR